MTELFSFLRNVDLLQPPTETMVQLRRRTEARLKPVWIAFYHRDGEFGDIGFEPSCTSELFLELVSKNDPARGAVGSPTGILETAGSSILKQPATAAVEILAPLCGAEPADMARFFQRSGTASVFHARVAQGHKSYGSLFLGTRRDNHTIDETVVEVLSTLYGHICYVFDMLTYEKTRAKAFNTIELPSVVASEGGEVVEVNPAFLRLFDCESEEHVRGTSLEEYFSLPSGGTESMLSRQRHIARAAVAKAGDGKGEISGVLHSVAGASTPQGIALRYLYFLPDTVRESESLRGTGADRRYPQLELPRELSLTAREIDVAVRIAAGESSKEIARRLDVSIRTIQFHRQSLRDKLGIVGGNLSLRHALLQYERHHT